MKTPIAYDHVDVLRGNSSPNARGGSCVISSREYRRGLQRAMTKLMEKGIRLGQLPADCKPSFERAIKEDPERVRAYMAQIILKGGAA